MNGLVLTAGGARGAYQAGVLKRIGEIPALQGKPSPFPIVTGASAGAINGAAIAAGSEDFAAATKMVAKLWGELQAHQVYRTDALSMGVGGWKWIRDLSLGGMLGGGNAQSLLDFTPLRKFLQDNLNFDQIEGAIARDRLYALAISATSYYSGQSFTFIEGKQGHPIWKKSRRTALAARLHVDHIWASCAIPVVFQPVRIETELGHFYFGDGGLRLVAPCSAAIRLGADKIFAIGIRSQQSAEDRLKSEFLVEGKKIADMKKPPLAQVFGISLNSIFLDHLDTDLEHLKRMNQLLASYGPHKPGVTEKDGTLEPMRPLQALAVNPSVDLADIAEEFEDKMPRIISYFMDGLGHGRSQSADLMSYLLFDPAYTGALIDVGYRDAAAKIDEIEDFLRRT